MIKTMELMPGVTLRCCPDHRFKQGGLSLQLVRPMCREEAGLNALLPAVLLRGSVDHPDLRSITLKLDELYGASVSTLVRRVGDYQTTGLFCGFMDDRFALPGDRVMEPMLQFLGELLLKPSTRDGAFLPEIVESEKKNLIATIESERNDKRAYAMAQLFRAMCREDSYGVSRLGEKEQVAAITPRALYDHYQKILKESPMELFYVGTASLEQVAALVKPVLEQNDRSYVNSLDDLQTLYECPGKAVFVLQHQLGLLWLQGHRHRVRRHRCGPGDQCPERDPPPALCLL